MKKLVFASLLVIGSLSAQAGGHYYYHHYGWGYGPSFSFYYGGYPYYSPWYPWSYYPGYTYGYYPGYNYDGAYAGPNYAVNGTLLGALTGGLIGNSIHHQGWEGAGIGAAAGLLLGSLADYSTRVNGQTYARAPAVSYVQPNAAANALAVKDPPAAPAAPQAPDKARTTARSYDASSMSSANRLFGR